MIDQIRILTRLVLVCFLMGDVGMAARAGTLEPRLESALKGRAGAEIAVIVTFAGKAELGKIGERDRARRSMKIIQALQGHAAKQRKGMEDFLRAQGRPPARPLWIANAVALSAPAAVIRALAGLPGVENIRLDEVRRAPKLLPAVAPAEPEWNLAAVQAPELWAMGLNGSGVVVASMDTGVDIQHDDLGGRWRGGSNSWFDPNGQHAAPYDANGHGTAVMGLMTGGAATGSPVGVAPGARWIAVKIFDDAGESLDSRIHEGFQWLLDPDGNPQTDDAPDVVNNSWSIDQIPNVYDPEFEPDVQALRAAGIGVVFAAGNTGPAEATSVSPANYLSCLSVGSLRQADGAYTISLSSGRGPSAAGGGLYPRLTAPGEGVKSCGLTLGGVLRGQSVTVTGTSYAAPHVTGAIALLRGAFPGAAMGQIERALERSAADLGTTGPDNVYGCGMPDAVRAYWKLREVLASGAASPWWGMD